MLRITPTPTPATGTIGPSIPPARLAELVAARRSLRKAEAWREAVLDAVADRMLRDATADPAVPEPLAVIVPGRGLVRSVR